MNEQERRLEAIRRVIQGESVTDVCADLERSRPWYYKWRARFETAGPAGLGDRRQDNTPTNATPEWLQTLIIETRDRLEEQAYNDTVVQGIGARAVVQELQQLDIAVPHWTTVHRILKAAGRIGQTVTALGYCPRPPHDELNALHQIDIWPRVLHGGERLYFFHLIDVACWYPYGTISRDKSTDTALDFLVAGWQTLGLPHIAQFDNEMTFTGGRWAQRLGRVVRLCLAVGVEVWFIPSYTPERNGYVERFHGECEQYFWSRRQFADVAQVQESYPDFLADFRAQRQLPAIQDHTPDEMRAAGADEALRRLRPDFHIHHRKRLPLVAGTIHCARLADTHGQINVLNRHISLGRDYARHYILARIDTAQQQVVLYHQASAEAELMEFKRCEFSLKGPVQSFDPAFNYSSVDR